VATSADAPDGVIIIGGPADWHGTGHTTRTIEQLGKSISQTLSR